MVGLLSIAQIPLTYEGSVATRARVPFQSTLGANTQYLSRSSHVATENLTSIRLAFGNFNGGFDGTNPVAGLGTSATEAYSIEYPVGVFTRLLVAGASPTTIPNGGLIFTDRLAVSIPSGAVFWVWKYGSNSAGITYNIGQNTLLGDKTQIAASGLSDGTLTGTITDGGLNIRFAPFAILGMTRNPSVVIVGDSIGWGVFDTEDSSNTASGYDGKVGVIARSLGNVPFINLSVPGMFAQNWATLCPGPAQLIQKGSHLITQLGQNDFAVNGRSSAQLIADLQAIWPLARSGQKIFQTTLTPSASSSDGWTTLTNQTPNQQPGRTTFAAAVKATIAGSNGFFDVRSAVESSPDADKWTIVGGVNTEDGVHPSPLGYAAVQAAGVVGPIV